MKTYLVTGSTGVVGSAVVERLLLEPDVNLRLLIRARSSGELMARAQHVLEFCEASPEIIGRKVRPLLGDTTAERFGLSRDSYDDLAAECTNVIHCAGAVRMNLSIDDARKSAVGSAKNVIALLDAARMLSGASPKTEFISTVGVGGRLAGKVPERWIEEPREFHNTYEQAKAEAETLVKTYIDRGYPITVHRPSMVVGNSVSGRVIHFQVFYHLAEFLSGRRTFGIYPDVGSTRLDLIGSDCVANAVVWSSGMAAMSGRILHLCAGPSGAISVNELRQEVRSAFLAAGLAVPAARKLPAWLFKYLVGAISLVSNEKKKRALSTLPVFLDYLAENQTFSNENSSGLLAEAGILIPNSSSLVTAALRFYLSNKYQLR